jgi:hypothetical protein
LEKLQAEQKLASEQDSLDTALLANRLDVTDKFFAALETARTSNDDLAAQKTRLDAGSISPIAYQQSELSHAQNVAALNRAKHQLFLAHVRLEQAVLGQTVTQTQQ